MQPTDNLFLPPGYVGVPPLHTNQDSNKNREGNNEG